MKRVSETNDDHSAEIPLKLGKSAERAQPPLAIVVPLEVPHIRMAIRAGNVHAFICTTVLRLLSGLYRIWHRNAPDACTK